MPQQAAANAAHHLTETHFPACKEDLLRRARDHGAGQDILEVLESLPEDEEFKTLDDLLRACGESDQAPQTGIIDRKP